METPYEELQRQMESIQQPQQPQVLQSEVDQIMSKKKEAYRIEIRKRKMDSIIQHSRQRVYLQNLQNPQQQQQQRAFEPLQTQFNSDMEEDMYFQNVLNNLKNKIDRMVLQIMPISTEMVDETLRILNSIIDLLTNEEERSSDINRCCKMIKLGICTVLRPLIMDIRFKEFVFFQNNVYNLYGTLMYVDTKFFEEYLDDDLISLFMNSIVSDQTIIIEQGLFLIGNLMIGNFEVKKKLYEMEIVEALFQIHKLDRLNTDNHGEEFWLKIQDLPWVIQILIDRSHKDRTDLKIVTKDTKRLIEICFDLLSLDGIYEQKRIALAQVVSKLIGDLVSTTDSLIDFFFNLCSLKHVDMTSRFMAILNTGIKGEVDVVLFQNVSHIMFNFITGPDQYVMRFVCDGFLDTIFGIFLSPSLSSYSIFLSEILWAQRRELTYVLTNVMKVGTHKQLRWLLYHNVMKDLLEQLLVAETKVILAILDGLNTMLTSFSGIFTADGENVIMADLERFKFSEYLNQLQQSKSKLVYDSVILLIQKHYNYE